MSYGSSIVRGSELYVRDQRGIQVSQESFAKRAAKYLCFHGFTPAPIYHKSSRLGFDPVCCEAASSEAMGRAISRVRHLTG